MTEPIDHAKAAWDRMARENSEFELQRQLALDYARYESYLKRYQLVQDATVARLEAELRKEQE